MANDDLNRLKVVLVERHKTAKWLAEQMGKDPATISKWCANKDREIREKLVLTGDVDVMVSVGNNFFYTLSLPCSLWFFDKAKRLENKNRVLFIDARDRLLPKLMSGEITV